MPDTSTPQPGGRGSHQQFVPDAQGHYHTGNKFFDNYYEQLDEQDRIIAADPRVQELIASKGSGTVNKVPGLHDTDVKIVDGVVTHTATGGVWKPLIAAGAVAATGGILGAYVAPAAAVTAPTAATGRAQGVRPEPAGGLDPGQDEGTSS